MPDEENATPDTEEPETTGAENAEEAAPATEAPAEGSEPETTGEPETTNEAPSEEGSDAADGDTDALAKAAADAEADAAEEEEEVPEGPTILLFDRWDTTGVVVNDQGLLKYMNLRPVSVLHTGARHANKPFAKQRVHLVERFINQVMRTEMFTGKKASAYRAVRDALQLIEDRTDDNPVQVLVKAIENSAPREEVTRLRYGGISVPKAVDTGPSRRLDIAIRHLTTGAVNSSHKSKMPIHECIASEVLKASKADMNSFAVGKKEEIERVAKSAR